MPPSRAQLNGWDTHYIVSWIATILLKEQLGYNVVHMSPSSSDYLSLYSNPENPENVGATGAPPAHVNIEKWDLLQGPLKALMPDLNGIDELGATGFYASEGAYTHQQAVDEGRAAGYSADWWYAYLDDDAMLASIDYTLGADEQTSSQATCVGMANTAGWQNWEESDCVDGFFVTQACVARAAEGRPCGNLILQNVGWGMELILSTIGLELPMRIAFLGYSGGQAHASARIAAGEPVFFYYCAFETLRSPARVEADRARPLPSRALAGTPDVWLTSNEPTATRVTLSMPDLELWEAALVEDVDMKGDGVAGDAPAFLVSKIVSGDFALAAPQAYSLLDNFKLKASDIEWLLARYDTSTSTAGEGWDGIAHYRAACDWVKAEYLTWSTWINEFTCDGGNYYDLDTKQCEPCPVGTAAAGPSDNRFACEPCAEGFSTKLGTGMQYCQTCEPFKYADKKGAASCQDCPQHAECPAPECPLNADRCPGGTDVVVMPGYWRTLDTSVEIHACEGLSPSICPGGNGSDARLCADGYVGVKCASCAKDWYKNSGVCEKCTGDEGVAVTVSICAAIFVAVALVLFVNYGVGPLHAKLTTAWRKYYNLVFDMAKFKVIWSTYQIIVSIEWVLFIKWPEPFASFVGWFKFMELNIDDYLPMTCLLGGWSHYSQLLSSTLGYIAIGIAIGVAYFVREALVVPPAEARLREQVYGTRAEKFGGNGGDELNVSRTDSEDLESKSYEELVAVWREKMSHRLRSQHINAILLLSFVVLPTTSVTVLRTFHCEEFKDIDARFLSADYARQCGTPEHASMVIYAIFMILVYPVGIPCAYFAILFTKRDRINPNADSTASKLSRRRTDKSLAPIEFLFKYVRPERWWFEVADAVRRVMMVGVLVFVKDDRARIACVGFSMACACLVLFEKSEPYLTASVNALAVVAQWQLMCVYFAAILLKGEPFEFEASKLMLALVIVNIVLILGTFVAQYIKGSSEQEAKLKMLELEFRESEAQLSLAEIRADFEALQKKAGIASDTSLARQQSKRQWAGVSMSISHSAKSATSGMDDAKARRVFSLGNGKVLEVSFTKAHYPCFVIPLSKVQALNEIITHEDAMARNLLEELTPTTLAPSCAYTFFISQNWENRNSPDNNEGTKLKWLKNMKTHLKVNADNECWIWWDLICVPQHNRELQKKAIASLAYYATLCSRFIPLVRDRKEWEKLYEDRSSFDQSQSTLPAGTLETYLRRGWCRVELIAALCPKRFKSSGVFRPGPLNLRFRYHQNPNEAGAGPRITASDLLDPRAADFTNPDDSNVCEPVIYRLCQEYDAYERSGSTAWDLTIRVRDRPEWMREVTRENDEPSPHTPRSRGQSRAKVAQAVEAKQPDEASPDSDALLTFTEQPVEKFTSSSVTIESIEAMEEDALTA